MINAGSISASSLPPLADDIPLPAAAPARRPNLLARADARLWAALRSARRREDRKWFFRIGGLMMAVAMIVVGVWAYLEFRPRPVPDYLNDDMDLVLDYTLISGDFNKQPIDKRLAMIKDLIQRLKTMSATDSMLMAEFAARIQSEARRQLEENAKKLAMDMLDKFATDYGEVAPEDQANYLDKTIIDFTHMMEDLAGQPIGLPKDDAERLAKLKDQAKRDEENFRKGASTPMRADRVAGFLQNMRKDADKITNPQQQARTTRFVRDITRHLRGQDPATGKPR